LQNKLTPEELKELTELYHDAQDSPVMALSSKDALSGNDFSSRARNRFADRWAEIAKLHGVSSNCGFNSTTGEIVS